MKRICSLLCLMLVFVGLTTSRARAADNATSAAGSNPVTISYGDVPALAGDAATTGMHTLAAGLKHGARALGDLPHATRQQVAAHSPHVRNTFRAVADRAGDMLEQLSVEVTSLSLQILRSAFSSLWAFISGLLLS